MAEKTTNDSNHSNPVSQNVNVAKSVQSKFSLAKDVPAIEALCRLANKVNAFFLYLNKIRTFKFSQANIQCLNNIHLYTQALIKIIAFPKFFHALEKARHLIKKFRLSSESQKDGEKIFEVIKKTFKALCSFLVMMGVCLELKIFTLTPKWVSRGHGLFLFFAIFYALLDFTGFFEAQQKVEKTKSKDFFSNENYCLINKLLKLFIVSLSGLVFYGKAKKWRWNFPLIQKTIQLAATLQPIAALAKRISANG